MTLPTPATVVEQYLAAILDELRALRVAVGDRALARFVDERINEALGQVADAVHYADSTPAATPPPSPTKRTRARTPR